MRLPSLSTWVLFALLAGCGRDPNPAKPGEKQALAMLFRGATAAYVSDGALATGGQAWLTVMRYGKEATLEVRSSNPAAVTTASTVTLVAPWLNVCFLGPCEATVEGALRLEAHAPGTSRLEFVLGGVVVDAVTFTVRDAASLSVVPWGLTHEDTWHNASGSEVPPPLAVSDVLELALRPLDAQGGRLIASEPATFESASPAVRVNGPSVTALQAGTAEVVGTFRGLTGRLAVVVQ